MQVSRRILLQVGGFTAAAGALGLPVARAQTGDARMAERGVGKPDAPVRVDEYFSLTCPHCAHFAAATMPQVHKQLIDTGKLYFVYHDFPLDQLALTASAVARSLPVDRYEPFIDALLASQDRWAFARGVNSTEELWKMAALAGLGRPSFDAAIKDGQLKTEILQAQDQAQKTYQVDSTPTFIVNGPHAKNHKEGGDRSFADFAAVVSQAA